MTISTTTTWKLGQHIFDTDDIYRVSFYHLDGIPVRCLMTRYDNFPVGMIFHILGHGDWIYFNSNSIANSSILPRVLNKWKTYTAETSGETERLHEILSKAYVQAAKLMNQII